MSFIIGSKCVGVCDTACVNVCPVACIHGPISTIAEGAEVDELREKGKIGDKQLFINPDDCIDCGACVPECPVEAIYDDEEQAIEDGEKEYVKKNYEFFDVNLPNVYKQYNMKFFIDTANLDEIREAQELGVLDGVTTNRLN